MNGVYPLATFKKMDIEIDHRYVKPLWPIGTSRKESTALFERQWVIPNNSVYPREDFMLNPTDPKLCQSFDPFLVQAMDPMATELDMEIAFFLKSLDHQKLDPKGIIFNFALPHAQNFAAIAHYYLMERENLANTLSPEDMATLERLNTAQLWIQYFKNERRTSFYLTQWSQKMVSLLSEFQLADLTNTKHHKFVLFASTGRMVMAYLLKTGNFKVKCLASQGGRAKDCDPYPPYGSEVTWEVFQKDKQLFVEATYNGRAIDTCGLGPECPLPEFIKYIQQLALPGKLEALRQEFCRPTSESGNKGLKIAVVFNLAAVVVLLGLVITLKKRLR